MSSACSPPEVDARHDEGRFQGAGGKSIYWQSWEPPTGEPRAVVVIAHGVSEHGGRYRYVVERLLPERIAVYAIDHRGHGRSDGGQARIDRMDCVLQDLDQLVDHARRPGVPLILLGHSMGGCVSIAYALRHQDKLDGLALSSPLAAMEAAPLPLRVVAKVLSVVAPGLGVYDVKAETVSRDPSEVHAYETDPLNYRGKLPARTIQELVDTVGTFHDDAPRLQLPLLVQIGTADELTPPAGGRMVHDRAASADKTLHVYNGFFHELYNEPAGERDRALDDLAAWVLAHAG